MLVPHGWWGMTDVFTGRCDRLAAAGFVTLAPDLYGGRIAATVPDAESRADPLDPQRAEAIVAAASEHLRRDPAVTGPRIGGIGFSLGAGYLIQLATQQPALGAVVIFRGGSALRPDLADQTQAAILARCAEVDDWEPPFDEIRRAQEQLRATGLNLITHLYPGTGHWFFEENQPDANSPSGAQLAWQRTLEFLRTRL